MYNLETAEITRDKIVKLCEIIDDLRSVSFEITLIRICCGLFS